MIVKKLQQPGKLNLKNFQLVSDAVAKMNFVGESYPACDDKESKRYTQFDHSQLDGDEDDSEELAEYEQIYENEGIFKSYIEMYILIRNYDAFDTLDCTESDSCASSTERKARQQNAYYKQINKKPPANKKTKKKKVAIPVQTPRVPMFGSYVSPPEIPLHYQRMVAAEKSVFYKISILFNHK